MAQGSAFSLPLSSVTHESTLWEEGDFYGRQIGRTFRVTEHTAIDIVLIFAI
jgi:hypothetical protein